MYVSCIAHHALLVYTYVQFVMYHISCIMNHVSCIMYHISCIIYHTSYIIHHVSWILYHISCITSWFNEHNEKPWRSMKIDDSQWLSMICISIWMVSQRLFINVYNKVNNFQWFSMIVNDVYLIFDVFSWFYMSFSMNWSEFGLGPGPDCSSPLAQMEPRRRKTNKKAEKTAWVTQNLRVVLDVFFNVDMRTGSAGTWL